MTSGRKIRVSFADDLDSDRSNRIQISSDNSSVFNTMTKSKNQESSGNFNDMLLKRYNISKSQFQTSNSESNTTNNLKDDFTIDTLGENPEYHPRDELYKEIDTELAFIDDIPPLDELLTDLITKTENEKNELESSIIDCENYLNSVNEKMEKLDQDIKFSTDKLTFLFYLDTNLSDIVSLMDAINSQINNLKQMKKNIVGKLSKNMDNTQCNEYLNSVIKLKNKIGKKYKTAHACDDLIEFHNRYPDDYARSGLDGHVITILLFYAQFETLLWDPLNFFQNINIDIDYPIQNYIDTNNDITHFIWYQVASKFKSSDSFIRLIIRKVYIDAVFDLLKIWEWMDFTLSDRLILILKPVQNESQILDFIDLLMNKLSKIKTPEAMLGLTTIRNSISN